MYMKKMMMILIKRVSLYKDKLLYFRLRHETWTRLLHLRNVKLGCLLESQLSSDPVSRSPLLGPGHFLAIERRLTYVITLVKQCLVLNSGEQVLI